MEGQCPHHGMASIVFFPSKDLELPIFELAIS